MPNKIKVILDTDIGSDIDDSLALTYLLCQKQCDLLGITTVSGEAPLRAEMASAICRHLGRGDIPIHSGCTQSLLVDCFQKKAQQAGSLGKWDRQRGFKENTATYFLRQTIRAHPGEITLLAIGPMTNIAVLFASEPDIAGLLRGMVLMCGQFFNAMQGEWNAKLDPHAAAIIYGNGFQSRPPSHVSVGLDVTMQCQMSAEESWRRFTARAFEPVRDFLKVWFNARPLVTFHDPLAATCIFEPEICTYRQGKVAVSLSSPTLGWTVFRDAAADKPHLVAQTVDAERFYRHYFGTIENYTTPPS